MRPTHGFSLIELAIVLVIISLLLGSVLVGRDLMHAASIRATVAQVEKYHSAVDIFRKKYGYLPGDMPPAKATTLLFFTETTLTAGHGDGNGLLEGCATASTKGCGETLSFWRHLTDAALIDGNYGTPVTGNKLVEASGQPTTAIPAAKAGTIFPPARMGHSNFFTTYSASGFNYYAITSITAMTVTGTYTLAYAITPLEALTLDEKMDDGLPTLGTLTALAKTSLGTAATPAAGACVNTDNEYATGDNTTKDQPLCALGLRFQ